MLQESLYVPDQHKDLGAGTLWGWSIVTRFGSKMSQLIRLVTMGVGEAPEIISSLDPGITLAVSQVLLTSLSSNEGVLDLLNAATL